MRILTTLLTGALLCSTLSAQDVIVRQRNGQPDFFYHTAANAETVLNQAFAGAFAGDTIYLPAVTYTLTANRSIPVRVVLIGTGAHPDSTTIGGTRTTIACGGNNLHLLGDYTELHGLRVTSNDVGGVFLGSSTSTDNRTGMLFKRCVIDYLVFGHATNNTGASNNMVDECRITYMAVRSAQFTTIRNSIINTMTFAPNSTVVRNCVFLDLNQATNNNNAGVLYTGNIFMRTGAANYAITEASTFVDNLWVKQAGATVSWPGAIAESGSQQTELIGNVFQTPLPSYTDFQWTYNYHLVPNSPYTTMVNNGTDQVGIYGGLSPWKDGAVPFNPHWKYFYTPNATVGGTLQNVQIRATGQIH